MHLEDWIGFVGVFILLFSFSLNLLKRLRQDGYTYIIMNLVGSSLACLASCLIFYIPFIILEGAWTVVSFGALVVKIAGKKQTTPASNE